jgi:hypothetical protein
LVGSAGALIEALFARDTAAVVKEEASKTQPNEGKLKRWGGRLASLGKELGMKVAAAEIVRLLAQVFGPPG